MDLSSSESALLAISTEEFLQATEPMIIYEINRGHSESKRTALGRKERRLTAHTRERLHISCSRSASFRYFFTAAVMKLCSNIALLYVARTEQAYGPSNGERF